MRGDQRSDLSLMTLGGRTNAVLELGKRLLQPDDEWKDKCAALTELRQLLADFARLHVEALDAADDLASLFTPENVQALTHPFRVTLTDLRSTVVREACATLALLARTLEPARCKMLVRDVFPTLLDARGGSNKVNTAAIHSCVEAIVDATPGRFVLAPVLQVLETSKNREVRESCIHYVYLALEGWSSAALERFRIPLQTAIAASLSDASSKGREKARDCYWKYIALWPDEVETLNALLADGVKKHLKRSRKEADLETSFKPAKRRHLATITNTLSSKSTAKNLFAEADAVHSNKKPTQRSSSRQKPGVKPRASGDKTMTPPAPGTQTSTPRSRIPSTPTSALKKPREGDVPSKIPSPAHIHFTRTAETESTANRQHTPTYLESKFTQLIEEKASLTKKLDAQAHQLQQLQEQIQMMQEEKQIINSRNKDAMVATMAAHADHTATQQEIQYQLAEQVASQEAEIDELRSQSSSPAQSPQQPEQEISQLKNDLASLTEQLQAATAKLEASSAEAGDELSALRSEKSALEERLAAQSAQVEELTEQQSAAVAALEEQKRELASDVSALKSGQSEAMAQCSEKSERVAELESELSALTEQLQAATAKLEASSAEAGDELSALRSEKSALEERLAAQSAQVEELTEQQSAAVAALEEQKRELASDVSALKSGQSEAMAQCSEKSERVAELESELSALTEQLQAATAKLEASSAEAGDELSALRSEKSALEERLAAQSAQVEELTEQQSAAVAALEEQKRELASEVSALKSGQSEAMAHCSEKSERIGDTTSVGDVLVGEMSSRAVCDRRRGFPDKAMPKAPISLRRFSLAFARDRSEIEDEERRINEANLLKRRLRRQREVSKILPNEKHRFNLTTSK
ncbi:hypothetical protein PF008_g80 [Phytophthora fragariae]|uniref:TOG domain-containing protein n=1 Tax=Phytophthora fragariae TaxID=53985 RepID=A0A6G0SPL0_9STRA|nr:hypothetical protein PF008_g80 [Phytophthora fragariae]